MYTLAMARARPLTLFPAQRFKCAYSSECDEMSKVGDDETREWLFGVKDATDR
jgi:hypothetical protein